MRVAITPTASAALAALHASDPSWLRDCFNELTSPRLGELQSALKRACMEEEDVYPVIGAALLRRVAHGVLGKKKTFGDLEEALSRWDLPLPLREKLARLEASDSEDAVADETGGNVASHDPRPSPPSTWLETLDRLKVRHAGSRDSLWREVVNHPITEYVPVQCSKCGHIYPDVYGPGTPTDDEIGLKEVEPTDDERVLVRSGWYRGPRGPVVFLFTCPKCSTETRWFRSSDPGTILNPNKWGRLCGEQEDLRAALADYLGVPLRVAVPLDWDHTWSEFQCDKGYWSAVEDPARNFAVRLDEGIGAWSRVIVLNSNADISGDVSNEYLQCSGTIEGGRADISHAESMDRYKKYVERARMDPSGGLTQSRTVNGYVLEKAGMHDEDVTEIIQEAVRDEERRDWWDVPTT